MFIIFFLHSIHKTKNTYYKREEMVSAKAVSAIENGFYCILGIITTILSMIAVGLERPHMDDTTAVVALVIQTLIFLGFLLGLAHQFSMLRSEVATVKEKILTAEAATNTDVSETDHVV